MIRNKGFITVATGNIKYYELAYNLCLSYKKRGNGKYPFALICDRETEYNSLFDDVVIVKEGIRHSTLDKMLMRYSPYEESIFFDADILILSSVDDLWDIFKNQDDITAFGCKLPLDSQKGWFTYEGSGKYKPQIDYLISMNGGIYYFRKSEKSNSVFFKAEKLIDEYSSIDFKYFAKPADEPVMAMSMVLNHCSPTDVAFPMIILPAHSKKVSTNYSGDVFEDGISSKMKLIHFSTPRTSLFLYRYLDAVNKYEPSLLLYWKYRFAYLFKDIKFSLKHSLGTILRKLGLSSLVEKLKKII